MKTHRIDVLSLDEVAEKCKEQERHFHNNKKSDSRYCYELFRRALVNGSARAWKLLYKQYEKQMTHWVWNNSGVANCGEAPDYFVNRGFTKFWEQARKKRFDVEFPHLGGILQYLRICLTSEYLDYVRRNGPKSGYLTVNFSEADEYRTLSTGGFEEALADRAFREKVMENFKSKLKNRDEELVFIQSFHYGRSAREIFQLYPDLAADIKQIYRIKENILKRFRRMAKKGQIIN